MNDFSAMAFAEQGGLSLLSYIARQSPQLPPHMQAQLMSCFYSAVKHVELLPRFIEPPEIYTDASGSYATDVSVYQTLVLAMGNMRYTLLHNGLLDELSLMTRQFYHVKI
jgi:hypothetical protein